jgi:hypothetical protein
MWGIARLDRGTYLPCFRLILERCDPNLGGSFGRAVLHNWPGGTTVIW